MRQVFWLPHLVGNAGYRTLFLVPRLLSIAPFAKLNVDGFGGVLDCSDRKFMAVGIIDVHGIRVIEDLEIAEDDLPFDVIAWGVDDNAIYVPSRFCVERGIKYSVTTIVTVNRWVEIRFSRASREGCNGLVGAVVDYNTTATVIGQRELPSASGLKGQQG